MVFNMKNEEISKIFTIFTSLSPNPTSELKYSSPFELLCAVVLSAQTTDLAVNKVTVNLFKIANTPSKMANLSIEEISAVISSIGLYRVKAKYLKELSQKLITNFNGEVPQNEKDLTSLPGVGIKTARVILNTIFDKKVIAVDTHIFRVAKRLDLSRAKTPDAMSDRLAKIIPQEFLKNAHHHLILHGRYICKAQKPLCPKCPISEYCRYYKTNVLGKDGKE